MRTERPTRYLSAFLVVDSQASRVHARLLREAETLTPAQLRAELAALPIDMLLKLALHSAQQLSQFVERIPDMILEGLDARLESDPASAIELQQLLTRLQRAR